MEKHESPDSDRNMVLALACDEVLDDLPAVKTLLDDIQSEDVYTAEEEAFEREFGGYRERSTSEDSESWDFERFNELRKAAWHSRDRKGQTYVDISNRQDLTDSFYCGNVGRSRRDGTSEESERESRKRTPAYHRQIAVAFDGSTRSDDADVSMAECRDDSGTKETCQSSTVVSDLQREGVDREGKNSQRGSKEHATGSDATKECNSDSNVFLWGVKKMPTCLADLFDDDCWTPPFPPPMAKATDDTDGNQMTLPTTKLFNMTLSDLQSSKAKLITKPLWHWQELCLKSVHIQILENVAFTDYSLLCPLQTKLARMMNVYPLWYVEEMCTKFKHRYYSPSKPVLRYWHPDECDPTKHMIGNYLSPDGYLMFEFRDYIWYKTGCSEYGYKPSIIQLFDAIRDTLLEMNFDPVDVDMYVKTRDLRHFDMVYLLESRKESKLTQG